MRKKVTFADIAEKTGFSKTTVSRYFNDPETLTIKNRRIIENAIKELGYTENKLAKVLANGKSEIVGVVIPSLYMHFYSDLLAHILSTGERFGYKFLVFNSDENRAKEKEYLNELLAYNVEGLIVVSHATPSKELAKLGIPVVTIEREDQYVNSVNTNNYQGGLTATEHLIGRNCDVLIHINADLKKISPGYGRIRGFRDAAEQTEIPTKEYLLKLGNRYELIRERLIPVFEEIEETYAGKVKGIFVSNDTAAKAFLSHILIKYRTYPRDYKLIGFDDSPVARESLFPISTIHQDTEALANNAIEVLVKLMNERKKRIPVISKSLVHRVIDTKLIVRKTTE